ncbi:MAG: hypothetical protein ACYC6M_16455 [Terriglobales bacterium]
MTRPTHITQLALAVLAGGLLAGGGYALASSSAGTIHACASTRTHVLLAKNHCTRGETSLSWNTRGPIGSQGKPGATGPQGPEVVGAWGELAASASPGVNTGQNLAISRVGVGDYSVSITGGPCATQLNAVIVTPESASALGADVPEAYAVRTSDVGGPFTVMVGDLHAGAFTPTDSLGVDVAVYCNAA